MNNEFKITLSGEQKKVLFLPINNPIQIKGVAGSGKTTIAIFRAKHLIDTNSILFQESNVVIFTFNKSLVKYIRSILPYVNSGYQENSSDIRPSTNLGLKIQVTTFHKWAYNFIRSNIQFLPQEFRLKWTGVVAKEYNKREIINFLKEKYNTNAISNKKTEFFLEEISWIKGKLFKSKDEYLNNKRIGRGTEDRVRDSDKEIIWEIYLEYNKTLLSQGYIDYDDFALLCLEIINSNPKFSRPFTHIVVDEAQDLSKAQFLVITQLVSKETNSITIIADSAQRIYKSGFTWKEVGLNLTGNRTTDLKKNYRSTVQIVKAAKSLLDKEPDKSEFTVVEAARKGEFKPLFGCFNNNSEQMNYLIKELQIIIKNDKFDTTAILHRFRKHLKELKTYLKSYNIQTQIILDSEEINFFDNSIKLCTMSSIKGLEFDNVFIIDLNDDVIPYPYGFSEDNDEYHISTERRLLYTSMTRAKKRLYLLSSGNPSRFIKEIDPQYINIINNKILF